MVIVDTSALLAYLDQAGPDHASVVAAFADNSGPFVVSELVLAELDYLVLTRYGVRQELAVLDAMGDPRWRITALGRDGLAAARSLVARYADAKIGLTDAANVVLAERFGTDTVATLDRRRFAVLRLSSGPIRVVP
ncbi:MAG: PIN domain-containing protein [Bifidobacteriaceae bacterium]|jgi:predicted nucleic acid-binding protein|nr:PIN domain-containing protein [Bifidobacteriaceae bacterium]